MTYAFVMHSISYKVYYEDTDAGGIMYHGNYINFCERARTEYMNAGGLSNRNLYKETGALIVVRHLEAGYLKPIYLEDVLRIETVTEEIKNSSFRMKHTIFRGDEMVFTMSVVLVCINEAGRPVRVPGRIAEIFQ